jgi:eukaryotic-like serine/threonine-protein kinase
MNDLKTTKFRQRALNFAVYSFFVYGLLSMVYGQPLFAASSPLFRANAQRTGEVMEQATPKLTGLWNYDVSGEIASSPVTYKDIVYCGDKNGSVWAWDVKTGNVVWQYNTGDSVDATPCVTSDAVYVPSKDNYFYAFDRLTGDIRWQTYTGSADCSSPVLYKNKLYFLSGHPEHKLYSVDSKTGQLTGSDISQFGFSSPAIKGSLMFFGTNDGQFHCFDLDSGSIKWNKETDGTIFYSTLACGTTYVYAISGGDERKLYCLDPNTGDTVWYSAEISTKTSAVSSICVSENELFVVSTFVTEVQPYVFVPELRLLSFPLTTASSPVSPNWARTIGVAHPTGMISSPVAANGIIYVGSGDGNLYCLKDDPVNPRFIEPGTGNLTDAATGYYLSFDQSYSSGIVSSPCVANGLIFASTYDGQMWAFQAQSVTTIQTPDNDDFVVNKTTISGTVTDPAGYDLEYGAGANPSSWTEIKAGTTSVSSGALAAWNTAHLADGRYTLKLTQASDPAKKAINKFTIDNSPQSPGGLTAEDTPFDGGGSITLSWSKSFDDGQGNKDVQGYKLYKGAAEGSYAYLASVNAGVTSFIDNSCPAYATYYYVVTSFDNNSESVNSNPAHAFSLVDGVEIDPETGGTIALDVNGMKTEIVIEPGSMSQRAWFGIRIPASYEDNAIPVSANDTGIIRELGISPSDTKFLKPVTIKIPYREQDVADMKKENLRIYWFDGSKNEWRIVNTSDPNFENGRVWAYIPHFSFYRIMEYAPGKEELLSQEKAYTYPNPAKGATLAFKYYLGDKADVTIEVYNVAGELIARLEKDNNPAGIVSELEWNMAGVASGVYVYRIEARSASATKAIKKKLAIIH